MKYHDRQDLILQAIRKDGFVEVETLAAEYAVTTQTIRKDLAELCDRGLAARTHGGARRVVSVSNHGYEARRAQRSAEKEAIARAAAALIPDNCSIFLNIGTTTEQVAQALGGHKGLVIISNNVNIISSFIGSKVRELILVGGAVRQDDGAIVGEDAVEFIGRYKADYAIIGTSALDDDGAVLDFDAREVAVSRAILRNARMKILVADSSKFDRSAPVRICDVAELDYIVTDGGAPKSFITAAKNGGAKVIVVGKE
ncbi:MAG: DeoR/GlpR transcriptional regulator [Rhodobacteraceae bacterium]|nr:DeoR/GlpR transcriptional regulator [Paracoccaceae bacterium]